MPVCVSFLLLTFLIAPLVAGTPSESAFKKLRSLAGKWEGKDAHGRAAKTSFEVLASGTAVMEKLEASGMEEMVTLYSVVRCAILHWIAALFILLQHRIALLKEIRDGRFRGFFFKVRCNRAMPAVAASGSVVLRFRGGHEINHLPVVSSIDAEVGAVDSEYLGAWVPLAHYDNRCVGQIHLLVACHKGAEPLPVCRNLQVHANCIALEQLKQRIDVHPICT